ncbi:MAG: M28 family peptidase [Salinivirgaceae bacterium]
MYKTLFLLLITGLFFNTAKSQDRNYAHKITQELSSEEFFGRGAVNNGDILAARYIAAAFKKLEVSPIGKSYLHPFEISINTFPDRLSLKIDETELTPGLDYMVGGGSPSVEGRFELVHLDTLQLKNAKELAAELTGKVAVLPAIAEKDKRTYELNAEGYIFTRPKRLYWRLSDAVSTRSYFYFHTYDSLISNAKEVDVDINSVFYKDYKTANVLATVEGTTHRDSFYVFTAHYDHLGMMGDETIFYGANDNASGTAMILDLARHYSLPENKPKYSMVFMAFAAEESGLFGSKYTAENPPIDLGNIKFLFNLDMVGSGSEGIGMVNAKLEPEADSLIRVINKENDYFTDIRSGGASCNSDHCAFAEKGVPAIFIFTRGKEQPHYHTPLDKGKLALTKWDELFQLLVEFTERY